MSITRTANRPTTAKPRVKRSPKRARIKSASKKVRRKTILKKSPEKLITNRRVNQSFVQKGTNISVSSKHLSRDNQSNMPTHYMTMTNNWTGNSVSDKRKRIYSAKPALNDSRKFLSNRYGNDPYIVNLSPANKIPETSFVRFSTQTAPSTIYANKQHVSLMTTGYVNNDAYATYKMNSRSTESSLSNLTHVQNSHTLNQLEVLEKIREKEKAVSELTNLKHIDCKKLLINTNKQLKKVNYKLKNLISNGESHIELIVNNPQEFEVLDEIPLYCKLKCKNHKGPARFVIKFITKGRIKSYVSMKASEAPKYKSDRSRFNVYPDENEKIFECDFIYAMFMSTTG